MFSSCWSCGCERSARVRSQPTACSRGFQAGDGAEDERVQANREDGAGEDEVVSLLRQQAQRHAQRARMKENSPICASARRDNQRRAQAVAEAADDDEGGDRLADDDDR